VSGAKSAELADFLQILPKVVKKNREISGREQGDIRERIEEEQGESSKAMVSGSGPVQFRFDWLIARSCRWGKGIWASLCSDQNAIFNPN
jgi:hypothetical protein